jgi:ABC-type glycerol-3-phosphate transport system substrate-binding protein
VAPAALKGYKSISYTRGQGPQQELERMVDQFNQTNEWGIHVIQIAPGSAAMEISKTWEGIANQQAPNVIATPLSFLLAIDEKDQLVVDLTPYVESAAYGLDEAVLSDFNEKFWLEDEVANKRYGIPAQRSALLMAYNNAWAAELGFESPPNSVEDFKVQACAANAYYKKDEDTLNDGLGGWLIDTGSDTFYSWLFSLGAEPL